MRSDIEHIGLRVRFWLRVMTDESDQGRVTHEFVCACMNVYGLGVVCVCAVYMHGGGGVHNDELTD